MKVSLKWLSEYVDVPSNLKAFCDRLDLTGPGVEAVETLGATFDHVVTAQVLAKEPHPDSDHLWVCSVDVGGHNLGEDGAPEPVTIVCGAQNFEAGDHIVTALPGAELPGGVKIKKSKLRGVASCGMNCSARELGLSSDHSGIMILPADAPVGMAFSEYAQLTDTVLDLEITPNRPDCLSMVGMAREVGAMYRIPYKNPLASMAEKMEPVREGRAIDSTVSITIPDPDRCPRYTARIIRGVKIGPSPDWLVERLASIGQRSINNVVDVTNYILFLFGQPLHSFDLGKVRNAHGYANIVVRAAEEGEVLETLDGVERQLTPDMTVIATPDAGAIALAGVMGGAATEVTDETTEILLEAATFCPGRTSRTSRNLGLFSESSMRYERGVDDHGIDARSAAACALIVEVAGGEVVYAITNNEGLVDAWPKKTEPKRLQFRVSRFCQMMGASIPRNIIVEILKRLGCAVEEGEGDRLQVVAPTFRPDLEREIDLYEEVLRLWGMDRIPPTLPGGRGRFGTRSAAALANDVVVATLRASGLNETMTYSFADPEDMERLGMRTEEGVLPVELINPLNSAQSVMRQSILPGLLRSVAYNQARGVEDVQLFEVGTVFSTAEGRKKPKERQKVAGVLAGSLQRDGWNTSAVALDFFDAKGVVENLVRELALAKVRFAPLSSEEAPFLQPGRAASVTAGGTALGWVGEIHPKACEAFEAKGPVAAFELDLSALQKSRNAARPYVDVPSFPPVEIDQAFVVDEAVSAERMGQVIQSAGGKLLESVRLFDVFRDADRIGAGKKSMAFKLVFRSPERTLTSEEVEKAVAKLQTKVQGATGAEVRA